MCMFAVSAYMFVFLKLWSSTGGCQCGLQVVRGADFHDCSARWLHPNQRKPSGPENMVPRRLQRDAKDYGVCKRRPADQELSLPSEQVSNSQSLTSWLDIEFHVPVASV